MQVWGRRGRPGFLFCCLQGEKPKLFLIRILTMTAVTEKFCSKSCARCPTLIVFYPPNNAVAWFY